MFKTIVDPRLLPDNQVLKDYNKYREELGLPPVRISSGRKVPISISLSEEGHAGIKLVSASLGYEKISPFIEDIGLERLIVSLLK